MLPIIQSGVQLRINGNHKFKMKEYKASLMMYMQGCVGFEMYCATNDQDQKLLDDVHIQVCADPRAQDRPASTVGTNNTDDADQSNAAMHTDHTDANPAAQGDPDPSSAESRQRAREIEDVYLDFTSRAPPPASWPPFHPPTHPPLSRSQALSAPREPPPTALACG